LECQEEILGPKKNAATVTLRRSNNRFINSELLIILSQNASLQFMKLLFSFISLILILGSCQKEYGDSIQAVVAPQPPPPTVKPTAVFTFDGAPNPCTNIARSGMFSAGVPLTASHMVKIDVNVIVPGTYFISTQVVNGFSFSGSGELNTAGYGAVVLQAMGTPVNGGTFVFSPGNNGCPFAIYVYP
jgi:hypothetical protein